MTTARVEASKKELRHLYLVGLVPEVDRANETPFFTSIYGCEYS